jgi:type II secretory pathway component PulF
MSQFSFTAIDSAKRRRRGTLYAQSAGEARTALRQQGLVVLELKPQKSWRPIRWSSNERLLFVQQLGQLLRAGLPVFDSLEAVEQRARGAPYHPILFLLLQQVQKGQSLSEAMGHFPQYFDGLMRALIAAGELSGALPAALSRLEALLVRQQKIRAQLRQALTYPAVVLSVAILIVIFLLVGAVPALEPLLEGRPLEGMTATLIHSSRFLRAYWPALAAALGLLIGLLSVWASSAAGSEKLRELGARIPLLGRAIQAGNLARFFRTLLTLISGGLSVLDSLRMARQVSPMRSFTQAVQRIEKELIQGQRLSECLAAESLFPPIVSRMFGLAEESGELAPALEQLAVLFEEETESRVNRLQQMLQPLILVILGLVVGMILMGILVPLTDVQQLVGGTNG